MSKEQQIIDILTLNPFISQKELAKQVGLSRPAVANYIANLTKRGIIKGRAYILQKESVVLIGAANIDREARTIEPVQLHTSNPVDIKEKFGGVARNYASALRKRNINTTLLTAVGDDAEGEQLLQQAKSEQIDISHVWVFPSARTGTFTSLVDQTGELIVAMADMKIYENITIEMVEDNWPHIQSAKAIFLDMNMPENIVHHLIHRLREQQIPLYIDGVSPSKIKKLPKDLSKVTLLTVTPKEIEALYPESIVQKEQLLTNAKKFINRGVENLLILTEKDGIIYYTKELQEVIPYNENFQIQNNYERNLFSANVMYELIEGKHLKKAVKDSVSIFSN